MKTLAWMGVWLAAALSPLAAQSTYVWVANGGGAPNSIMVHTPTTLAVGTPVATLNAATFNFNAPYDIVSVPRYNRIVVSNNGAGAANHLTVIDSRTFAFVANVTLANAANCRGMSVSGDEEWVFVAARHNTTDAGVYRLRMSDLSSVFLGGIADAVNPAEDVVVVNASVVGGSGNGPGKVYFTVPATSSIGTIASAGGGGPFAVVQPVLPAGVANFTNLERTPDHAVVFAACTTTTGTNFDILRIVPGVSDTSAVALVFTDTLNKGNTIKDVVFRPGLPARGYALAQSAAIGIEVHTIDASGLSSGGTTIANVDGRIRYDGNPPTLYIGDTSGTSNQYGRSDASGPVIGPRVLIQAGTGPRAFAFSTVPAPPVVSRVCPEGLISVAGTTVEIHGSGFIDGGTPASSTAVAFVDAGGVPFPRTVSVVSDSLLIVNGNGLGAPGLYDVRVTNPDTQVFRLASYFVSINAAVVPTPYAVTLPSRAEGYALRSFPQFATAGDLQNAVNAQFGGYNPNVIRIFFRTGGGYTELSSLSASDPCTFMGRSFWALTRSGGSLQSTALPVGPATQLSSGNTRVMIIEPGWNMISQPVVQNATNFEFLAQSSISVYDDETLVAAPLGTLDATAGAAITSFPVEFLNGSYVFLTAADKLRAGRGYWLRNNTSGPLYLRFLCSSVVVSKGVGAPLPTAKVLAVPPEDALPPAPPGADTGDGGSGSGCGALGVEALLALAFLRAVRRRRLAA